METFDEYRVQALRTAPQLTRDEAKKYALLKLAGEVGEVCDLLGKHIGQGHELDINKVTEELGDVLWHLNYACEVFGSTLAEIANKNIAKLQARYPDGFSVERSINR